LAKYLGKSAGQELSVPGGGEMKYVRRWGRSALIKFAPFVKPTGGWEVLMIPFKELLGRYRARGEVAAFKSEGVPSFVARPELVLQPEYSLGGNRSWRWTRPEEWEPARKERVRSFELEFFFGPEVRYGSDPLECW
jgi:hypothetical protein